MNDDTDSRPLLDALPYIDVHNESYEQYALALIEEEMRSLKAPPTTQLPLVNFRNAPFLKDQIIQRDDSGNYISNRQSLDLVAQFSLKRPLPEQANDISAWREAVKRARITYETERLNGIILEADKEVSSDAWKRYNERLTQTLGLLQIGLTKARERVETVNYSRQLQQQEQGRQLHVLSTQHQSLIEKHFQLKQVIAELQQFNADLKREVP